MIPTTGEDLYGWFYAAMRRRGIVIDEWHDLPPDEQAAWKETAANVDRAAE